MLGGGGIDQNKSDSENYFLFMSSLKSTIKEEYKEILIDISRIKEADNYLFQIYGKKQ